MDFPSNCFFLHFFFSAVSSINKTKKVCCLNLNISIYERFSTKAFEQFLLFCIFPLNLQIFISLKHCERSFAGLNSCHWTHFHKAFFSKWPISLLSPLENRRGPLFQQTWIPFIQGCFVRRFVEIDLVVLKRKSKMWNRQTDGQADSIARRVFRKAYMRFQLGAK